MNQYQVSLCYTDKDVMNLAIFMLYSTIRGVIVNHNISKEHKIHFTTANIIERYVLNVIIVQYIYLVTNVLSNVCNV